MVDTVRSTRTRLDEIVHQYDPSICVDSYKLRNTSGAAYTDVDITAQPVKASATAGAVELAATGEEANVIGFLMRTDKEFSLANNTTTTETFAVFVRGPAVLVKTKLPTLDVEGGTFVMASLLATYAGLGDIAIRAESAVTFTQTT